MTNEQIKEIALANGFKLKEQPNGDMDLNPYVYDFARALLDSRWISVKDRLPEYQKTLSEKDKCLALTKCGKVWMGFYNTNIKPDEWYLYGWLTNDGWHPFEVTHWQPLPEPPEGDE